jgi:hypothetical protein
VVAAPPRDRYQIVTQHRPGERELVSIPEQLPRVLALAMRSAVERRGVAVIVVPGEVFLEHASSDARAIEIRASKSSVRPDDESLAAGNEPGSRQMVVCAYRYVLASAGIQGTVRGGRRAAARAVGSDPPGDHHQAGSGAGDREHADRRTRAIATAGVPTSATAALGTARPRRERGTRTHLPTRGRARSAHCRRRGPSRRRAHHPVDAINCAG